MNEMLRVINEILGIRPVSPNAMEMPQLNKAFYDGLADGIRKGVYVRPFLQRRGKIKKTSKNNRIKRLRARLTRRSTTICEPSL